MAEQEILRLTGELLQAVALSDYDAYVRLNVSAAEGSGVRRKWLARGAADSAWRRPCCGAGARAAGREGD
jgi:hypothetical protein